MTDHELIQALTEAGNSSWLIRHADYWAMCCRKAASRLSALQSENAEKNRHIAKVEAKRDAAIADIPHICATCGRLEDGMCPILSYKDYPEDCEHWQWRGVQGEG